MKKLKLALGTVALLVIATASAIPASAAPTPVTYLNANFGPPDTSGFNFYRSSGTIKFDSPTASVFAKASGFEVEFSASSTADPNETSAGFSSYDVGTVNAAPGGMTSISVSPRTLSLSGSAHFCMNLWFDSSHDGEYFDWDHNRLAGLGGDAYAIGTCSTGTLVIDQDTPLFVTPGCPNPVTTLAAINAGLCLSIPPETNVAMWVGIDIPGGTTGSGNARL